MSGWRSNRHGWGIDRSAPLSFTFDGKRIDGLGGDTLASALLASGQMIVGRSFKYHRPRGFWGAGVEEPNGLADLPGARHRPNVRMTTEPARDGAILHSVNASPTAERDRGAFLDLFSRFIPAAFYYKTFIFPSWHLYEDRIRAMAGLGRVDPGAEGLAPTTTQTESCDCLVVGAGPAGLAAALAAAGRGERVILCDQLDLPGGSLLWREAQVDGQDGRGWAAQAVERLRDAGAQVLLRTTAFGLYEHGLAALAEDLGPERAPRLRHLRAGRIVIAAGMIERPLPFANNDLPGVMSAEAALHYLRRFGVVAGRRVVVATNNGIALEAARALAEAGADVTLVDQRDNPAATDLPVIRDRIRKAIGRRAVTGLELDSGRHLDADAILVSGGYTPTVHLWCQAQGKLRWDESIQGFVPGHDLPFLQVAGAAAGRFTLAGVLEDGARAGGGAAPRSQAPDLKLDITPAWPEPGAHGRIWLDMQNDVTAKDVELAARENFTSVEHLKRYTTLGMAADQGKTSNLPGLALMARITGRSIEETGTTTYRPPYVPVPFASYASLRSGHMMNPLRRLPLETQHREAGARFREYGGWLRPAWFGEGAAEGIIAQEAKQARDRVALFDGSSLGKIEVIGPDAAAFLDFIFYNTISTLKPGRCRYGFILTEGGIVYDDGVVLRLDQERFVVSCSSSHVQGVVTLLENWRQDRFDRSRVFIHDATARDATLTVTGPQSRALVEAVGLGPDLSDAALPHMALAHGTWQGQPVRIARVSFTGDRSYELTLRADRALPLWQALQEAGRPLGAGALGMEALMILRAEKGYIVTGKDTDGRTRPMDLGITGPLRKKSGEYLGRRSLSLPVVADHARALVGLESVSGDLIPPGAHAVEKTADGQRSAGFVTTSHMSPNLNRPIALALVERGFERMGEEIDLVHLGRSLRARIAPACAFDPQGERLHV